jgi:hypothetical protein
VKISALSAFAAASLMLAFTLPAGSATGMAALQYYVGTWSCTSGAIGKQPFHFTAKYAMNGDILQSRLYSKEFVQGSSLTYDSKNHRYIDAAVLNDGTWFVAYATISGRTETSIDHVTSDGKLGRLIIVRTSSTSFDSTIYSAVSGGKALIKSTCRKS